MGKGQGLGVEHEARHGMAADNHGPTIARIPGDGPADMGQVDPQLVHPPGGGMELHEGGQVIGGQGAIARDRRLGLRMAAVADADARVAANIFSQQGGLDQSLARVRGAGPHKGEIGLAHAPRHHGLAHIGGGGLAAGGQEHARGVPIKPVDEPGPRAAGLGEGPQQFIQGIYIDPAALTGETGRLVYRQKLIILVDDEAAHEGDLRRAESQGFCAGHQVVAIRWAMPWPAASPPSAPDGP